MRKLPLVVAAVALGVGLVVLLRSPSRSVHSPKRESAASSAAEGRVESPSRPGTGTGSEASGGAVEKLRAAKTARAWPEVRRIKLALASASAAEIEAILRDDRTLLVAELLEGVTLSREARETLFARLESLSFESLSATERGDWLRFVVRYGEASGGAIATRTLRDDPRAEVKRDAALALGTCGEADAQSALEAQAQGGLAGVYSALALEQMRRRGAIVLSDSRRADLERMLEREMEVGEASGEALQVLTAFHQSDNGTVLVGIISRPDAPLTLRRRALRLLAEHGTEEDLEKLTSVPGDLEADFEIARREILARSRGRQD